MTLLRKTFYISALFIIIFDYAAKAQQLMTLQNAIAIGLKKNYDILMAKNQESAAANDYHYSYEGFLPTIDAQASKTWSRTDVNQKFSTGEKSEKNGSKSNTTAASANLNWVLFDGLQVFATRNRIKAILDAGEFSVKSQVNRSVANIITAYYNIVQQKQQLYSLKEQMGISQERVDIAKAKFEIGTSSKIDYLQAQVDLNAQKSAYLQQQTYIEEGKDSLNQLLGIKADNQYDVSDSIPVNLNLEYNKFQNNIDNNPSLKLAKKNIDISRYSLQEIQRSRLPVISFNSSYSYSKQNSAAGFFLFNQSKGFQYGFTASIPIFNAFDINRQAQNAKIDIAYQQLSYQNQRSQVNVNLLNAYKEYEYYKKDLQLEEQNLDVAKENVKVALEAFKQGQTTTIEVKVAQQGLLDQENRLTVARYRAKTAEVNLMRLNGDLVK